VSRARYEMVIYSTMRSDHIDLNRTSSIGVLGLKRFLEYAEKGNIVSYDKQVSMTPGLSIHSIIAERLRSLGYVVHTDIGCSGYRIDIGIVDDKNPSKYKLGIICDGENYKRTKTVRDREVIQNSVLKLLGWNLCRVWTLDWWENPDSVISSIEKAMDDIATEMFSATVEVDDDKEKNNEVAEIERNNGADTTPGDDISINGFVDIGAKDESEYAVSGIGFARERGGKDFVVLGIKHFGESGIADNTIEHKEIIPDRYIPAALNMVVKSSDVFFDNANKALILKQIKEVMDVEAPISRSLLCKRILSSWSISRSGQKLDLYLDILLSEGKYFRTSYENLIFYWLDEQQYLNYNIYRTGFVRDAIDLPPEEVANAVRHILIDEISLPVGDISKVCSQKFGFMRSGSNVDAAMSRGLEVAIRKGYIKMENGRVVVV